MTVIDGYGGYVPLYRIDRDVIAEQHGDRDSGELAVPAHDENHITMGNEATATALARADITGRDLGAVFAASITDPFAEHGIAAHLAYRVGATGDVRTGDFRGTTRAATDALFTARDFVANHDEPALVVGTDILPAKPGTDSESSAGAAAGALVVRADSESPAATMAGTGQETTGFVERHRRHGEPPEVGDQSFETQHGFVPVARRVIERALAGAGTDEVERAVVTGANQRSSRTVLAEYPDVEQESTFGAVGFAGTASFYLDLVTLLEDADDGESALGLAYGPGGADALVLSIGNRIDDGPTIAAQLERKEFVTYAEYLRYRECATQGGRS